MAAADCAAAPENRSVARFAKHAVPASQQAATLSTGQASYLPSFSFLPARSRFFGFLRAGTLSCRFSAQASYLPSCSALPARSRSLGFLSL